MSVCTVLYLCMLGLNIHPTNRLVCLLVARLVTSLGLLAWGMPSYQ